MRQDHGQDLGARRQDHGQDLGARRQDHGQDLGARRQDHGQDLGARRQDHDQDLGARRQDHGQDLGARRQDHGQDLGPRRQDHGQDECSYDELKRIRIAVEGILEHLITNSQTNKGIGGPILAYSGPHLPHQGSPAPPVPKQILPEVQPASPSGANHSPEYFLTESGVNLLNLRGADINKYALNLMDALYTEDELKTSSFVPVGKSSTSVKPPLSPQRMQLLEG
ncbi:hypothetical protein EMCRGX_G018000 [Ephydatia muelleri]